MIEVISKIFLVCPPVPMVIGTTCNLILRWFLVIVVLFAFLCPVSAQYSLKHDSARSVINNVKGSYLFPINPGTTATLSGTMGELRNTHFHAGLDIDTPDVGVPVKNAQDGYISHATTTTSGYGNVLYVTHPDGNTTLYAHLDEFKGPVSDFIRQERYNRKLSEIDIEFRPNQFPVRKGEVIALSGNTGSSGGPHLHFEVRNSNNEAINPLQYAFAEVKDNVAPFVQKIALKTFDVNSRINDQFGRFEFTVLRDKDNYTFPEPILANGDIGVEVLAFDKMQNSRYRYGINHIEMYADNQLLFTQDIDKIDFAETRGILALMDYPAVELRNVRFNKLYRDDGNRLSYYPNSIKKQAVKVNGKDVSVLIKLQDYNGNVSNVRFTLKSSPLVSESSILPATSKAYESEFQENILKVSIKTCVKEKEPSLTIWEKGTDKTINPSYSGKDQNIYLIDLRSMLPDSIVSCHGVTKLNLKDRILPDRDYKFYSNIGEITFPHRALYDTLYFSLSNDTINNTETFHIGNRLVPLHKSINVMLKPTYSYSPTRDLGVYRKEGNFYSYIPSTWQNGNIFFSTRNFGDFIFMRDTIPPTITQVSITNQSARMRIKDNLSGISYFEATINGQWLLMVYDYKTGMIRSERLDSSQPLNGDFELKVVDNAGNKSIYKQKI